MVTTRGRTRGKLDIYVIGKSVRRLRDRVQINANRLLGREFVPHHANRLFIETSSLCNLDCKFCAYGKKHSAKVTMDDAFFEDCVEQALEMGLDDYHLTPCTGDVFMDRSVLSKLDFLEAHAHVKAFDFFTNFTIPTRETIAHLLTLRKLKCLHVSVYGHDLETFVAITGSTATVFRRLLANLETLYGLLEARTCAVVISIRSNKHLDDAPANDLLRSIERFRRAGIRIGVSRLYNNWGGMITQADVRGLDIDINPVPRYKKGACTMLFTGAQIMATGIVNGCACRDVDATLRLGDLHEQPLRAILSPHNEAYARLIREQQQGHYRPVCESCDYYKSIYRLTNANRRRGGVKRLDEFLAGSYGTAAESPARRITAPRA